MGVFIFDKEVIRFESLEDSIQVEYKEKFKVQEVKAYKAHTLIPFWKQQIPVTSSGKVNTKKLGKYQIVYTAANSKQTQSVHVVDTKKPKLKFVNDEKYQKIVKATDNYDGDLTSKIKVKLKGNQVTYTVKDSNGNKASLKRKVNIPKNQKKKTKESKQTIYLTFDDGPSEYTDDLLEILDTYNVKATFFTTSAQPDKAYLMKEAHKKGHTVAVHTETHIFAQVYSSDKEFWKDFDNQNKVIKEMTGKSSTIFRFPGGSSNTISLNYSPGIMTRLVKQSKKKKLQFFDWNVSSGDAGLVDTREDVYDNVVLGIIAANRANEPSIVLQHDTHGYSVDAVEKIILWGLDNGYEFKPLTYDSFAPHHPLAN